MSFCTAVMMQVWIVLEMCGLMPYWVLQAWSRRPICSVGVVSKGTLTFAHPLACNYSSMQLTLGGSVLLYSRGFVKFVGAFVPNVVDGGYL
jgi:hypothetical protein